MSHTLSELDTRLLNLVQEGVPLTPRPFAEMAQALETQEATVIDRLVSLRKDPPVIRQISAIFDSKALGYKTTLVACRIDPARLDEAAAIINQHPGVTHNYKRTHDFNLWYTLASPPDSKLGLEGAAGALHRLSGASATRLMPTLKLFKIGVKLNVGGDDFAGRSEKGPSFTEKHRARSAGLAITPTDQRMIRVLQQDLQIIERPFDGWAAQAEVTLEQLLEAARRYESESRMRRFSAVLRHREVGFGANGMGVWVVPPEKQEEFGQTAATFDSVTHCYLRPSYEDWPYNIFTMVHAPTEEQCNGVLSAISKATGITRYSALYSTKEYKKTRLKYFTGDIEAWESQHAV